jgi:hypothetical protein
VAQQRNTRSERRAVLPQPRRDRGGDRLERKGLALEAHRHGDHRHARASGALHQDDVPIACLAREHVHVHVRALRFAEPDGCGLGSAAAELLPQQRRVLACPADREDVLARPRGTDVLEQLPDRTGRDR